MLLKNKLLYNYTFFIVFIVIIVFLSINSLQNINKLSQSISKEHIPKKEIITYSVLTMEKAISYLKTYVMSYDNSETTIFSINDNLASLKHSLNRLKNDYYRDNSEEYENIRDLIALVSELQITVQECVDVHKLKVDLHFELSQKIYDLEIYFYRLTNKKLNIKFTEWYNNHKIKNKKIQNYIDKYANAKQITDPALERKYSDQIIATASRTLDMVEESERVNFKILMKKSKHIVNTLHLMEHNINMEFKKSQEDINSIYKETFIIEIGLLLIIVISMFVSIKYLIKNIKIEMTLMKQSKTSEMGNMIGNIAHQWKQPLNIISTITSNIKVDKELGTLDNENIIKSIDKIDENVMYLSETIDTFRNFIKEEKVLQEVILQNSIDKALKIVEATLKKNFIEFRNNINYSNPINYTLMTGEIEQVIINIISNAKDALLENNIKKPWIKLDLIEEKDNIKITIEDNAGGIPKNILPKIFNQYFTTKDDSKGTGLGLHMSKRIVIESLHGDLYVKNTEVGAKFSIILPLK